MNENIIGAIVGVAVVAVLVAILVLVFRWLWNSTMPEVFGVRELSTWQASCSADIGQWRCRSRYPPMRRRQLSSQNDH